MPTKPSISTMVEQNKLSGEQSARILRLLRKTAELRKMGMKRKTYDLASPFENKLEIFEIKRKTR